MIDIKTLLESEGLYQTTLLTGEQFTWRLLTMKEYRVFRGLREANTMSLLFLYEMVFDHCYLGNADAINGHLPAGYFPAIGECIMWLSGDCGTNERDEIEVARMKYAGNSVLETMKRIVYIAFPYLPEQVENWTRAELVRKFTLAEAVLVNKGGYELLDTKKIMSAEKAKKQKPAIDFRKENEEYNSTFGANDKIHPLDLPPDMLFSKQKSKKISTEQAKQLDRAQKRGK